MDIPKYIYVLYEVATTNKVRHWNPMEYVENEEDAHLWCDQGDERLCRKIANPKYNKHKPINILPMSDLD